MKLNNNRKILFITSLLSFLPSSHPPPPLPFTLRFLPHFLLLHFYPHSFPSSPPPPSLPWQSQVQHVIRVIVSNTQINIYSFINFLCWDYKILSVS